MEIIARCAIIRVSRLCLDFLLPSKNSLREIKINFYDGIPEWRAEQMIKFVGYERNMEYSNISTELPRLRKLTMEVESRLSAVCDF